MCTPSIRLVGRIALILRMVAPLAASAMFSPRSSSSAVAVTLTAPMPVAETWNVAVSSAVFASSAAASVTTRQELQLDGVNLTGSAAWTDRSALPDTRLTVTVTTDAGAFVRRTKKRPSPFSRTLTLVLLSCGLGLSRVAVLAVVEFALGQPPSPSARTRK